MAAHTHPTDVADEEVVSALDVIRRHARLKNTVQVFVEAGIKEATGYRRLNSPGDLKLEELARISDHFHVPLHVIAEGELATARWFKERNDGPRGPRGLESDPSGWLRRKAARNTGRRLRPLPDPLADLAEAV